MQESDRESSAILPAGQRAVLRCSGPGRMAITIELPDRATIKFWTRRDDPALVVSGDRGCRIRIHHDVDRPAGWPLDEHDAGTVIDD